MYLINKKISIVGGGLVGSLLSIYLSRQGAKVSIFDKREDLRLDHNCVGRSINLALSDRGLRALKELKIDALILKIAMPMYKRIMHSKTAVLTEQPYGKNEQAIYSVSRRELNIQLLNIAEANSVKIFFQKECSRVDFLQTKLEFSDGCSVESDFIFGADGAGSVVRKSMAQRFPEINIMEDFIDYSYKELSIPPNRDGSHRLENKSLHIWPRKSYMVIALPNLDGSFTCTLFAPNKGKKSFTSLTNSQLVDEFFNSEFYDLKNLIPDLATQYFNNPTSNLGFVRSNSWRECNTILLGDACHATVPFYGQGMNAGFEDCFLLNNWLNQHHSFSNTNFMQFLKHRIIDTMAMQDLSMSNFIEMRDKTADPQFLLQKQIERWFSDKHPDKWEPLYSMVTFSRLRYSEAMKKGQVQNNIMQDIMIDNNLTGSFDIKDLEKKNIEKKILLQLSLLTL